MRDLIYRDDAIKELDEIASLYEDEEITGLAKNRLNALIPATPDTRLYSDGFADGYKQGQKDRDITLGDILDLLDETRTSSETVIISPDELSAPVKSRYWEPLEGRKVNNIMAEGPNKLVVWLEDEGDPEDARKLDEWRTDCKEYDKERHNCPRFNRVIREALEEVKK